MPSTSATTFESVSFSSNSAFMDMLESCCDVGVSEQLKKTSDASNLRISELDSSLVFFCFWDLHYEATDLEVLPYFHKSNFYACAIPG